MEVELRFVLIQGLGKGEVEEGDCEAGWDMMGCDAIYLCRFQEGREGVD